MVWLLCLLIFWTLPSHSEAAGQPETISVAYCEDCVPFQFKDENGKPKGMVIDHWRFLEKKPG